MLAKKITRLNAFTSKETNNIFQNPLPIIRCCFLGHEQFPGNEKVAAAEFRREN